MYNLCCLSLVSLLLASTALAVPPGNGWKNSLKPAGKPGPALTLASAGKANYTIVLPAKPTTQEEKAASDLSKYLKAITSAQFSVIRQDSGYKPTGREISVGKTDLLKKAGIPESGLNLGREGYAIAVKGETLYLMGGTKRGPIYAVYALLEEDLGCRWYDRKSEPTLPSIPELKFKPVPRHFVPVLNVRDPFYWDAFDGDWAIANRASFTWVNCIPDEWGGSSKHAGNLFVHTYNNLLPPKEYFDKHQEYFSEVGGKRQAIQLCLTNPDVLRIVTDNVLKLLRDNPGSEYISVSPNDCMGYCECAKCKAIDDAEGTHAGTLIMFVNKVAEAVEKEFPDVRITTLAYLGTIDPPKTIRPRSNVVIQLCTDSHAWPNTFNLVTETEKFQNAMKAWHAIGATMHIWDYTVNFSHYSLPMPNMPVVAPALKFYVDNGAAGVLLQGAYQCAGGENAVMRSWVWAKQLWDPNRPTLPLMKDFIYGYYGEAADPMWQYNMVLWRMWENVHAAWLKDPKKANLPPNIRYVPTWEPLTGDFVAKSAELFGEAEKLAKDPETLRRVKLAKFAYLYMRLSQDVGSFNGEFALSPSMKSMNPQSRTEHLKMLDEFEEIVKREKVTVLAEVFNEVDTANKIAKWREVLTSK